MKRWNYETQSYDEYTVPDDCNWVCPLMLMDMDAVINCASCGKKMIYGAGYTSKEIHTDMGMGYSVCGECYENEVVRSRLYE